jgi:hypothetical protein
MRTNIIKNYLKNQFDNGEIWGLDLAIREFDKEVFEIAGLMGIDIPSLVILEKDIEKIKIKDRFFDWLIFEIKGRLHDSDNDEISFSDERMLFLMNINKAVDDHDRIYFLGLNRNS